MKTKFKSLLALSCTFGCTLLSTFANPAWSDGAYESYDDKLRQLSESHPEFAGVHVDNGGNLVLSIADQANFFLSAEDIRKQPVRQFDSYDKAEAAFGEPLLTDLGKIIGPHRFRYMEHSATTLTKADGDQYRLADGGKIASRPVRYSFAQLYDWYEPLKTELIGLEGVSATDIDESRNKIVIYLTPDADLIAFNNLMKSYSLPRDAFSFKIAKKFQPNAKLIERATAMSSGLQLFRFVTGNYYPACTMGLVTKINGVRGFLASADCAKPGGEGPDAIFHQGDPDNYQTLNAQTIESPLFGTCNDLPCYRSQAVFVPFPIGVTSYERVLKSAGINSNNLNIKTGSKSVWSNIYIDTVFPPVMGDTAFKTGRSSGTTSGDIVGTCQLASIGEAANYCVNVVAGHSGDFSAPGDSGATVVGAVSGAETFPFTYPYSNAAKLLGMVLGNNDEVTLYDPIGDIDYDLGGLESM